MKENKDTIILENYYFICSKEKSYAFGRILRTDENKKFQLKKIPFYSIYFIHLLHTIIKKHNF